jgi:hypothetical protein
MSFGFTGVASMPSREELHALVETLPEESIEMALKNLKHLQTPPRKLPPELEEMRKQARQGMFVGGGSGSLHFKLDPSGVRKRGSFHSSASDGDARVSLERFLFNAHEFVVRQRIEPHEGEKKLLVYLQVEGPDDQKYQYEATLDLPV